MIRAAEKFDPRFGRRFSIYASYWIKEAIHNALLKTASTIRLPCHMVVLLTKWRRAERVLSHKRDCMPRFDEVSSFLGLSEAQKAMVVKAHKAQISGGTATAPWIAMAGSRISRWAGKIRPGSRSKPTTSCVPCRANGTPRQPRAHRRGVAVRPERRAAFVGQRDQHPDGHIAGIDANDRAAHRPQARRRWR